MIDPSSGHADPVATGPITLACGDLDRATTALVAAGFRLDTLVPTDDPRELWLSRDGHRLRLVRVDDLDGRVGPPLWEPGAPLASPPLNVDRPLVTRAGGPPVTGRAGMHYRDLVRGRLGGALIASLIRIDDEGPVPDYVHHHDVDFQLIYCRRGRVRVVYEDQGDPVELTPGDAILQAPGIRHRVLWASAGLEVVEVTTPAVHPTHRDHELELPNGRGDPRRLWGGQRFVHHVAADAVARPSWLPGFTSTELGIGDATAGRAGVRTHTASDTHPDAPPVTHHADVVVFHVLDGTVDVRLDDTRETLGDGDTVVVPPGVALSWNPRGGVRLLEVAFPEHRREGTATGP